MAEDDLEETFGPEGAKLFRELKVRECERRRVFAAFTKRVRGLPTVKRAEAWLRFVVEHRDHWGDEEALTHLTASGHSMTEAVRETREEWRAEEADALRRYEDSRANSREPNPNASGRAVASLQGIRRVRDLSRWELQNFWSFHDNQEFHIDAVMLRAVEICEIGGFDDWWDRVAKEETENAVRGGLEQIPASYWLFAMSRCRYAQQLMPIALERTLERVQLPNSNDASGPWRVFYGGDGKKAPLYATHNGLAANMAFAASALRADFGSVALGAARELVRNQMADGWWPPYDCLDIPSPDITARAVLALAAVKPVGYRNSVQRAASWLVGQQDEAGYWHDRGQPDAVYLTVLVLDALAAAGTTTTERKPSSLGRKRVLGPFKVALSFPGDMRPQVESLAHALRDRLPADSVFYDSFYKAELARPNLDQVLSGIYRHQSELVVVFVGESYQQREWCGLEWRAVRDIVKARQDESVMFVKVDDGPVDGLLSIDGYIDFRTTSAEELVAAVLTRMKR